jgi:chemotaxis protein histidine kinase CheA
MEAGLNDVVRHIILRIIVDQAGLAEDLAAARSKLKALKDSEDATNKERIKGSNAVVQELEKQNKALDDNAKAHEASQRAAQSGGRAAAQQTKAETDAIKEQTKQVEARTVAEAKAAQIDSQTRQKELDAQRERSAARKKDADEDQARAVKNAAAEEQARQKRLASDAERAAARQKAADTHAAQVAKTEAFERAEAIKTDALKSDLANREKQRILSEQAARSAANKKAAAEVERMLADAAKVNEQANAVKSGASNQRKIARDESTAKVARQDYSTIAGEDRKDTNAEAQRKRADENAAADRVRLDQSAAHARELAELKTNSAVEAARLASEQKIAGAQAADEERLRTQRQRNEQSLITQALTDLEKIAEQRRQSAANEAARVEKLRETQRKNAYAEGYRAQTAPHDIAASVAKSQSVVEISGAKTDVAQSQAQVAAAKALNEEDRANASILERKNQLTRNEERFREDIKKVASQTNLVDQRAAEVAERRARATERAATARRRGGIGGGVEGLIGNVATAVGTLAFSGPDNTRLDNSIKSMRSVQHETGSAKAAVGAFFREFTSGDHEAASVLEHLTARVRNFVKELKPATSGGGNLISNIFGNIGTISDSISGAFDGMGKHIFSFQSLIIACIAALGPLAAILGAIGAAALGLASNLGALAGGILALPGIIGAAIAGFGGLAIAMKPLTSVFSAYSAAQKEAASNTNAARSALLDYKDAVLQQQEAEIAYKRAQQDGPRLQTALNDARKQATRDIEDYRTALRKLKFDEEGAQLGVESAEQAQRRAAADPTANKLDRDIAAHNVQGALFDQQDQATQARRTRQDAAEAFKKGVEGSDAVVAAERAVEDQTYKIQEAYIAWQQAIIAVNKAAAVKAAGGTAAAEYQRQLAKLPPETRKVAEAILDLTKNGGPFQQLRNQLSKNIFGPIATETGKFKDVLSELGDFLTPASKAMGQLAKQVLDLLTNPDWKAFIAQTGASSAVILQNLGNAALSVADAFRGIVTAARPFTEWVTGAIAGVAKEFDRWANSVDKDGNSPITKFLEITEQRITEIWPVIKNFAAGFAGFFAALNGSGGGTDFTTKFNDGLLNMSKSFRDLGEKAADPNSGFRKWLDHVLPLLGQIGHFLGAVGSAFGKLFSDPRNLKEAEALLHNLATKWLPQLAEIFSQLSKSGLISKLAEGIGGIFGAVQSFFDHGGLTALKGFADLLGAIGTVLGWLVQHVPILASLLGALAVGVAIAFGAGLITKITLVIAKFTFLSNLINGILKKLGSGIRLPTIGGNTPTTNRPGTPGTSPGSVLGATEELTVLRRMELYLRQIAINTGGAGNIPDNTGPDTGPDDGKGKGGKHRAGNAAARDAEEAIEDGVKGSSGKGSLFKRLLGFLGKGAAGDAGSVGLDLLGGGVATGGVAAVEKAVTKLSSSSAASTAEKSAASAAEKSTATEAVEDVAKSGLKSGLAGNLIKGAARGLPGLAATVAAQLGGAYLTDKFVRNDKDKASVNNGIGTVASWAGTGALLGSVIPGLGTTAGAVIGGAAGGIKAYATDPNLRKFVNKKVETGVSNLASDYKDLGVGKDAGLGGALAIASGPLGVLAAKTDIGKMIVDSLNKVGGKIGSFFTKTIPDAFHKGTKAISDFFTKTLPTLPGKFFDLFFTNIGRTIRFFAVTLPKAAVWFFTEAIPKAAKLAWNLIVGYLWNPFIQLIRAIPGFFTKTIPHWFDTVREWIAEKISKPLYNFVTKTIPEFFTKTIPHWFETAPAWFQKHVVDNVTTFFTVKVPEFFTKTLPAAIAGLPGFLYDHLVQPILDFFSGIAGHIGDLLKGSWGWVKGLFNRAAGDVKKGAEGKMSGGLITGVYQGIQDTAHVMATPGEFMVRKSKVDEPGAKAFLRDFNEQGMAALYGGLSASVKPPVMSMVPPEAASFTGAVPTVVNHTVNHAPLMGDVTINNPVREPSERSLRRQVQVAAIRHRR